MSKRLNKITREFNVGISTIVEFLENKGHNIDSNPNTKVPDELYDLLVKEFSSDIKVKKESNNLNLSEVRKKKETVSIGEEEDELNEKSTSSEDEEIIKEVVPDISIKVIGKIDLDTKKSKNIPVEQELDKVKHPENATPEIEAVAEKVIPEIVNVEKVENVEKIEKLEIIESTETTKIQEIITSSVETVQDDYSNTENAVVKNEILQNDSFEDDSIENVSSIDSEIQEIVDESLNTDENLVDSNRTPIENNVKVVGRIDLSTLNQKTRPDRKSKEEKDKERQDRKEKTKFDHKKFKDRNPENKTTNNKPSENKPSEYKPFDKNRTQNRDTDKAGVNKDRPFFKPKTEEPYRASGNDKLVGPTVIGKIDLPLGEESAEEIERKKTKRKRITKEKVSVIQPDDKAKKVLPPVKKKKKALSKKDEVSDEDIQKQVKDTMFRLGNKGSKSKSSKHRRDKREAVRIERQEEVENQMLEDKILKVTEFVSVNDLSKMMNVPVNSIISTCMSVGLFVSINQRLDAETIALVAEEFGFGVNFVSVEVQENISDDIEDDEEDQVSRPPIVTVMGHVDHGKTSLLDYIRKSNVIAGEAGGITQHIGAYSVLVDGDKKITFLDTPGHEAFTAMRARGAKVTDFAIIVVAADDNVMPQTVEAINHASAAGVPIIFAINKVDKAGANPDKIREELANMNYLVEEWGGKYQSQEISAKFGKNIDLLLEKVLLEAELLDLKANPAKRAQGTVIESELDKGRGYVSTLLVQNGTLKVGDILLAGRYTGKIKAMFNERNQPITVAEPSTPVTILGLDGAPQAGDKFNAMASEREAREIANKREQLQREQELKTQKHITLDEIGRRIAIGNFQELNIIIKGDVDGSVEALSDSLIKLSTEEIQVNVKHKAVGQISESDILLASASDAIVIGFQVRPSINARRLAEREGIDIRLYSIIYDAINEIRDAMTGMLSPEIKEEIVATAEIRETFKITKVGTIAGCFVLDGKIHRNSKVRIIRDGIVVYSGELASLKRHKDDAKEVSRGFECGLNIANFNDIRPGDLVEAYELKEFKRKL